MNVVILAAGIGSRLKSITSKDPKCMVPVAGTTLLDHQIQKLPADCNIHVMVGYREAQVKSHAPIIRYVNQLYNTTNNMYSLHMAKNALYGKAFFLMNGDVYIHDSTIVRESMEHMTAQNTNSILCDNSFYDEESMKIVLDDNKHIRQLSKQITQPQAHGISLDFYYITAETSIQLFDYITEHLTRCQTDWTEVALQVLMDRGVSFSPYFVPAGTIWKEIDTVHDLLDIYKNVTLDHLRQNPPQRFLIDIDGTILHWSKPIPGAIESINRITAEKYFLTNNTSKTKREYAQLLQSLGIENMDETHIITPLDDVVEVLKAYSKPYVFGNLSVQEELQHQKSDPDVVVITNHTSYTYDELCQVIHLIHTGLPFIATHKDLMCPHPSGMVPDIGAVLYMIHQCTGRHPKQVLGKPFLRKSLIEPTDTVVIGDSQTTDRQLADRHNFRFIQVLTGRVANLEVFTPSTMPQWVTTSITDLFPSTQSEHPH